MTALLKSYNSTALALDLSREGLRKLVLKDPTFPRPIKLGQSRQAAVFFDPVEIAAWLERKKTSQHPQRYGAIVSPASNDQ